MVVCNCDVCMWVLFFIFIFKNNACKYLNIYQFISGRRRIAAKIFVESFLEIFVLNFPKTHQYHGVLLQVILVEL